MASDMNTTAQSQTVATGDMSPAQPALSRTFLRRLRKVGLGLIVPLTLIAFWDLMVRWTGTRLIPPPADVLIMMWDFAFGGI